MLLRLASLSMVDSRSQPTEPTQANGLQLELLGVARLLRNGVVLQLLERRDAALLALLVIEGPTARARIAALIWPDSDIKHAGNSLRQRLFRLKRIAGQDVVLGDRLLALASHVQHDLGAFADRTLLKGDRSLGELLGSADYSDSAELGAWVQIAREQWRAARRQAMAEAASRLEGEGHLAGALELAERLVLDDPCAEHAHRRVMRLHYLRGDRAAALAAFERCGSLLKREVNASPGKETRQLASTIEASGSLQQPARAAPQPLPTSLRRPPRLVGRDAQWRQLEDAAAQGGTVLLEGEPGSGKSRLLQDFAAARHWPAPAGARPGDEAVPYALASRWLDGLLGHFALPADAALRRELARLVPRLADPRDPTAGLLEPARLLQALESVLSAWRSNAAQAQSGAGVGMLGMALDDLQFADPASLELLFGLASPGPALDDTGWCWVLALRADVQPDELRKRRQSPALQRIVHLRLAPLNEPEVEALLDSLQLPGLVAPAWAAPLVAHCGGHPFAIIDTLAGLHAQGQHEFSAGPNLSAHSSQRVGAVVRRLEQLPADAQQMAHVAAAAGQDFCVELAAFTLGCAPVALAAPWRTLEQAGLFRSGGFAHDLVRQAALDALPRAIEQALHRQIAQWLVQSGDVRSTPRAARIAAHWDAAAEWPLAARSYEVAAHEARVRSARREELQALDAAARCHRAVKLPAGDDAAFDCECRGVDLLLLIDSADTALARAQGLFERAGTDRQRSAALVARAHVLGERYQPEAALADALAAGLLADAVLAPRLQLLARQRAAAALTRLARPDEAVAMLQVQPNELGHLDDEERLLWLSDHASTLDHADRRVEAVAMFERAIAQAEALGHWGAANEAWGNKAIALMYLHRLPASLEASQKAIECGQRAGSERGSMLIDEMSMAGTLRDLGRFADYLARAEALPQALRNVGYALWACNAENDLAICFAWLGRPELAQRTLTPVPDDMAPIMRAARLYTQARLLRWRPTAAGGARPAALVRQANALIEAGGGTGNSYVRLKVALELARDEEPTAALAATVRIEAEAQRREQWMLAAHALVMRTELLTQMAATERAALAACELIERCERDGPVPALYAPEVWWVAYRALRPVDPARARAALMRAHDWIEKTAMPQVPAIFQHSFRERNPVNVAVRAAMAQDGASSPMLESRTTPG